MKKSLLTPLVAIAAASLAAAPVTIESLLDEMTDVDANTYFPEPSFTTRLWSSYDRATTGPDKPGWFANGDCNQCIRVEENGGVREEVMLDAKGPGAITRFWITVAGTCGKGDFRLYIDDALAVEGNCLDFVSGGLLCGAPLSDSVAKATGLGERGHDLYLPIPYAKSCKVTYVRAKGDGALYYNIETRTYEPGTEVESFSKDALSRARSAVARANRTLDRRLAGVEKPVDETISFDAELHPGQSVSRTVTRADGGAIRRLAMTLNGEDQTQFLRSTVLEMTFDGERTVWVPVGDFFGCGPVYESFSGWFTTCPGTGLLESRWAMPFEKTCTFTIRNLGERLVRVANSSAEVGPYGWDAARSMHFGAAWHLYYDVPSRVGKDREQWDYDYAELEGRGLFVGTSISLWQEITHWWGEGDEKVFVDGEGVPSYIGTGTEDHYGYAWCVSRPFSHPFICQPVGIDTGRLLSHTNFRRSVMNIRNRALDAIPFRKSIRYLMEMWHWADDIRLDFAPTACFYMRPGGKCNRGADEEAVRKRVRFETPMFKTIPVPPSATLFADFEGTGYGEWKVEGEAFGGAPARGTLPNQNVVIGFSGMGLVNTFYNGDDTTGTLTSPEFTVDKPYINFLCGGGNYKGETCVDLVVDGKAVRSAEGNNDEHLTWRSWDVSEFKGRRARIRIVDARKGHFGHINVDMIMFDDEPMPRR